MNNQIQEAQVNSNVINTIESTLRHIIVELQSTSLFLKLLKAAKGKKITPSKEENYTDNKLSIGTPEIKGACSNTFSMLKPNSQQLKLCVPVITCIYGWTLHPKFSSDVTSDGATQTPREYKKFY